MKNLRWIHELLFVLNVSLLRALARSNLKSSWDVRAGSKVLNYLADLTHLTIPQSFRSVEPNSAAIMALVLMIAGVLFLVLRLFSRLPATTLLLVVVPGFVALAGLPITCLYVGALTAPAFSVAYSLYAEIFVAVVGGLLWLRGFRTKMLFAIPLVILHFCLWGWASHGQTWFWLVYLVIGASSGGIWLLYVKHCSIKQLHSAKMDSGTAGSVATV